MNDLSVFTASTVSSPGNIPTPVVAASAVKALSSDQDAALLAFTSFIMDPAESVFLLEGYSGCGKTTLVTYLIDRLPRTLKMARLVNPKAPEYEIVLTATTNKAAENMAHITGMDVRTIHSYLGLRVHTDYSAPGSPTTLRASSYELKEWVILFIDEASYVDSALLDYIFRLTKNCKIVFIGDRAQLTPVGTNKAPVFEAGFKGAALTEVMRQAAGNPIIDISTQFRHAVNDGWSAFGKFMPDGVHIQRLAPADFQAAIEAEFLRPDWHYKDSKILAWTNKRVIQYNNFVRERLQGDPELQVGDYAVVNQYITVQKKSLKTDQTVFITGIGPDEIRHDVLGNVFTLDYSMQAFMPKSLQDKKDRLKKARALGEDRLIIEIEERWIDLRAVFASTINKAQGSTYGKVFIDLSDIGRCNSGNQMARMLYVGFSRAKTNVYLVGDIA